jgi:hypothetical protein
MKTYKIELRHAPSKNKLNAIRDNRMPPLTTRLPEDREAIVWARDELMRLLGRRRGHHFQYIEAGLWELYPIGAASDQNDSRRLGRWVSNAEGLFWRPRPDQA